MKTTQHQIKTLLACIFCYSILSYPLAQAQSKTPWPEAEYSHYAENQDLVDVLREFAASFSLALQTSSSIKGLVNGRFNTNNPTEFLNRLGGVYGFNWFVHAGTLYVSSSHDVITDTIVAEDGSISRLREALEQMGTLDARFGWGELPEQGLALISGPKAYINLIKRTVAALPKGEGGQQVAVFRLRHASVNDRTVKYRDHEITTQGVASILRGLLTSSSNNSEALSSIAKQLQDNPSGITENSTPPVTPSSGKRIQEPTIQADVRLNAVIVHDIPSRIPIYQELIDQLDVPSTLIEIEAMIVDVNSEVVDELGVTWGGRSGDTVFGYGNLGLTPTATLPIMAGAANIPGVIGVSAGNSLIARLKALEGEGNAQILSQPSILTADNLGSMIDLSETFYIRVEGERVADVTPITVGTSLRVTPRYIRGSNESKIELAIDIEDGSIQDERTIDNLPTVRKSNVSTLAIVSNGQALLIGGYNSSQESERIDKIPILGDIPGIGILFSSKSRTWQRRERLFLIRPRLISIDGERVIETYVGGNLERQSAEIRQLQQEIQRARNHRVRLEAIKPINQKEVLTKTLGGNNEPRMNTVLSRHRVQ